MEVSPVHLISTNYPSIFLTDPDRNPTLVSPNASYSISFCFDKEQSYDLDEYKTLLDSSIREFRGSRTYSHYKAYLMGHGFNRCVFHPYIKNSSEEDTMATLEMHHCMLTIYDVACMITEHFLNLGQLITEFDISELLRIEHSENRVPVVMLCKTCHQLYHNQYMYVDPTCVWGKWWELLERYKYGITRDIAYKLMMYLNNAIDDMRLKKKHEYTEKLLRLRENVHNWSEGTGSVIY